MNLTELKKVAAGRTKGPWVFGPFKDGSRGVYFIKKPDEEWVISDVTFSHDGEFIAACANHIDQLIAVAEAAKKLPDSCSYYCSSNNHISDCDCGYVILSEALHALERGLNNGIPKTYARKTPRI